MKKLLWVFLLTNSLTLFSQSLEIIGGVNKNIFFDNQVNDVLHNSHYTPGYGYTLRFGVEDIRIDWVRLRITLCYDSYNGKLEIADYGIKDESTTIADVDKSILAVGIFPLNFKLFHRIDLNLGFELGALIHEEYAGSIVGFDGPNSWNYDLKEKYDHFSESRYFGLSGRIAYDFRLTDRWIVSPQYAYYLNLYNEFDKYPQETRSMRHYFCLGLERRIK